MDLFAYDRSPEEALKELETAKGQGGAPKPAHGNSGGGSGNRRKEPNKGLSKSGTLEQVMARLRLQNHVNQVTANGPCRHGQVFCGSLIWIP